MESHIKIVESENSKVSEKTLDESNTLNGRKEFEKCDICSESFSNKISLGRHKSLVHPDNPQNKFHCELCSKTFPKNENLIIHSFGGKV